jgi:hypothetical protein
MKKQTGIWIDLSKAIIVTLEGENEKITEIESDVENRIYHVNEGNKGTFDGIHHSSSEKKFEEKRKTEINHFLKDVLMQVYKSDELYIIGPSDTKLKLEQKILQDRTINTNNIKLVETAGYMTSNQVISKVKHFFHPELYQANLNQ